VTDIADQSMNLKQLTLLAGNPSRTARFFETAFGVSPTNVGVGAFALPFGNVPVFLRPGAESREERTWGADDAFCVALQVDSVHEMLDRVRAAGARTKGGITSRSWGDAAYFADPDGVQWQLVRVGDCPPLVNGIPAVRWIGVQCLALSESLDWYRRKFGEPVRADGTFAAFDVATEVGSLTLEIYGHGRGRRSPVPRRRSEDNRWRPELNDVIADLVDPDGNIWFRSGSAYLRDP
jgi:predicted enzyme related to lactoylglutathione lyase